MQDAALDRFRAHLTDALSQHTLIKVVLANYAGNEPQLQRVIVRPIVLKSNIACLLSTATRRRRHPQPAPRRKACRC